MSKAEETTTIGFELPTKKVLVKPIIRDGQWLPKEHTGNFLYDNAKVTLSVPTIGKTGRRPQILTTEERAFFENQMLSGLEFTIGDLAENKRHENFWDDFSVSLGKEVEALNLSSSSDYLKYAVLRANSGRGGLIAPSWEERFDRASYRYALVEEDYDIQQGEVKAEQSLEAYKFFAKIEDSFDKMYDFLMVYWLQNPRANRPSKESKKGLLKTEIEHLIKTDIRGVLAIAQDENSYDKKVFIHNAMQAGFLTFDGKTYRVMPEDIIIGDSLNSAITYLYSPKNQETLLKMRALMEQKEDE